jgi:hypothetical protein
MNHPNIAGIYGLEKTPDLTALVVELVEGEDLSTHIARGAIPLAAALPIAKQVARYRRGAADARRSRLATWITRGSGPPPSSCDMKIARHENGL